jgi:hypothetical protein
MNYRIKRGDQEFGPYSLSDLQRYLQTGHVLAGDLAQSEGMSEWIPVSQILGDIPIPLTPQPGVYAGTDPNAAFAQQIVPLPPNMHWGWLLLLNFCTRSYFNIIWAFIQANWARKLSGKNNGMVLIAMYPAGLISGAVIIALGKLQGADLLTGLGGILLIAGCICLIVGSFKIRDAMEEYYNSVENIGLSLSGGMTFFFNVIYFQYHINRIARWKKTGELS